MREEEFFEEMRETNPHARLNHSSEHFSTKFSNEDVVDLKDPVYVTGLMKRLAKYLPTQGPLKEFIHHNPLHAFQGVPFHEGVAQAGSIHGANGYLSFHEFRTLREQGTITEDGVQAALDKFSGSPQQRELLESQMRCLEEGINLSGGRFLREAVFGESLENLQSHVYPHLFRILGNFLDQGISHWSMSDGSETLWNTLKQLVENSVFPVTFLSPICRKILCTRTPEEAIDLVLKKFLGDEGSLFERYLSEMVLSHSGWSGMVAFLEKNPETLLLARRISLKDAIAVELLLELTFCHKTFGKSFAVLLNPLRRQAFESSQKLIADRSGALVSENMIKALWQEAYEWSYFKKVLNLLNTNAQKPQTKLQDRAKAQLFFCIDDRECSLRRYIEEADEGLKTYGAPGFFGLDWFFKNADSHVAVKLCPAPVNPKFLVEEIKAPLSGYKWKPSSSKLNHAVSTSSSNSLLKGFFVTQVLGLWHGFKLALSIFLPSGKRPQDLFSGHIQPVGKLQILRSQDSSKADGLVLGFSFEEMADRVYSVLNSVGCRENFAPLMLFVAHGASSVNNPYFAAYNCGACSGRPGAANARAFAQMANNPIVRTLVKAKGIAIPEDTHFIGALHDTTRDEIIFFDEVDVPSAHDLSFKKIKTTLALALENNAKERCRRFDLVKSDISPKDALRHVQRRSHSIFEPRPELNHATNCLCVVGSRELTQGIFLDRRAFLQSYDASRDPDGDVLVALLSAAVPVCGGINLEYYFSRTDSERYGSGTKLSHNVMGLLGIANGVEGDLLTGLPTQMTERHPPLRLLMIVEQEPEILFECMKKNPGLSDWILNEWIRLVCLSPSSKEWFLFEHGKVRKVDLEEVDQSLPSFATSLAVVNGKSDDIDPVIIKERSSI